MFTNTRPHKSKINDKQTIKIGKTVPDGAVNLGYFYNKRANDGSENVVVSEAPKITIDHLSVTEHIKKYCLPSKDNKFFPNVFFYSDPNGYEGELPLEKITWYDHPHNFEKEVELQKTYTVTEMDIPEKTIPCSEYTDFGVEMNGVLGVVNIEYTPTKFKTVTETIEDKKFIRHTERSGSLSSPSYNFPSTKSYNSGEYVGNLNIKTNSIRYIPSFADSTSTWMEHTQSTIQDSVTINGVVLPFIEAREEKTPKKGYGFCRYWGSSPTGMAGWGGGQFTDPYPELETTMYTCNAIRWNSDPLYGGAIEALGVGNGLYYDLSYTEGGKTITNQWTKDNDMAAHFASKFGVSHNGGNMWVKSGMVEYAFSHIGLPQEVAKYMRCETIRPDHDLSYPTIGHKTYSSPITSRLDAYSHVWNNGNTTSIVTPETAEDIYVNRPGVMGGRGMTHFRDSIMFYRGIVQIIEAYYGKHVISATSIGYTAEADYEGEVIKTTTRTYQVPIEWEAVATFAGTIRGGYIDYNGVAKYSGVAVKRDAVGNINPVGDNVRIMYPDNAGLLHKDIYDPVSTIIESEHFYVTDMFKDRVPLFYSCRLKNVIYDSVGPDEFGLYTGSSIKLLNSMNKELPSRMKYAIKLTKASAKNTYYADVYTSFTINSGNPTKCVYTSYDPTANNPIIANTVENIYVQPSLQRAIDYDVTNVHPIERKNKITIKKPLVIADARHKITFEYEVVVFKDGVEVHKSNPITATAINHRYTLDKEKNMFIGRNYIVSPELQGGFKTGWQIIADDLNDTPQDGIYVARLTTNGINNSVKNIVNLHVSSDGTSSVSAEILDDTGFVDSSNDNKYTKIIKTPGPYIVTDGKIRCAYAVKCIDAKEIRVLKPREDKLLENWYPGVQFGHATQVFGFRGIKKKYVYSMPEFDTQDYCEYGRPYVRVVDEKAEFVNNNIIKVKHTPLYVRLNANKQPINLSVRIITNLSTVKEVPVNNWSFEEGIIMLDTIISETDNVVVTYDYDETRYVYRGYYDSTKFAELDLNTNIYHRHTDLTHRPYTIEKSSSLLNKVVYFFSRPSMIIEDFTDNGVSEFESRYVYRHLTANNTNKFPATVEVSEDGFYGNIGKQGEPYRVPTDSGTTWAQDYYGEITKAVVVRDATEVVFLVSKNASTNTFIKEFDAKIQKMYDSLKDSGIVTLKMGLCVFSDTYKDITFGGSKFTTSVSALKEAVVRELASTSNKTSKPFTAVKHVAETYPWSVSVKNIVLVSTTPSKDNNQLFNATKACLNRHIKIHTITDINDYWAKTLVIASNETGGNACDAINVEWENQLIVAIGSACLLGEIKIINKETIYHKIDDDVPNSKNDIYIGSAFIRHYTSLDAVQLSDSRTRGGGILETMADGLRHELEPESDYYFDIGYWDGEPYTENAVVIIKLDKRILAVNGGRFTEQEVNAAVHKWIALGTLPLIEYVDTTAYSKELNDKSSVTSVNTNKLNTKPIVSISAEIV